MAYEHEHRLIQVREASEVLGENPLPFNLSEPVKREGDTFIARVEHTSSGFEQQFMTGKAERKNGETDEQLVFSTLVQATNLVGNVDRLVDVKVTDENTTQVRAVDTEGTVWRASGATFPDASLQFLAAVKAVAS